MSDLIDRQAAVDALGDKPLAWTEGEYELGLQNQWQSDVDALKALPSAQPELSLEQVLEYCRSRCITVVEDEVLYKRLDSAYTEGYTAAESKYRKMWDEMQANIKEKAFGKRKGLIHTADIDAMPTIEPEQKVEELLPDGTLHLFTDTDLSKVDRVLVSQNGMHFGDLYYADGEPKIGKWIYNSPVTQKCNQCGFVMPDWDCHRFKYCPNCKARMVQEGEDNG